MTLICISAMHAKLNSRQDDMRVLREEIAFAMELRSIGIKWRFVSISLGIPEGVIKGAVFRAVNSDRSYAE